MTDLLDDKPHRSWRASVRAFAHPKVAALLFLGFSAGTPLYLVFSTLSVWLREAGVERATIGFFSWVALAYGFKFVWSPLIDKLPVPVLARLMGRRRAWLLVAQGGIIAALCFMALTDPVNNLTVMALGAVALAFSSATQDIVIDAYRIESADEDMQGLLAATYIAGYRVGMLLAGAGALEIAGFLDASPGYDYAAWRWTYFAMAGAMGIGVITTLVISEPDYKNHVTELMDSAADYLRFVALFALAVSGFIGVYYASSDYFIDHFGLSGPSWTDILKASLASATGMLASWAGFFVESVRLVVAVLVALLIGWASVGAGLVPKNVARETYVAPFADFFHRYGRVALWILALIATFRIADIVMGVMANVFYVDLGFEKQDIGRISKAFGLGATIVGGFLGGLITVRFGVMRTLFLGGFLAAATNVLFAGLTTLGPQIWALMGVITADNLSAGIATSAFVAYLSSLTSRSFTATQYALFSSMMMLVPKLIAGYSGVAVDNVGYVTFFLGTAAIGLVPLGLILVVARRG